MNGPTGSCKILPGGGSDAARLPAPAFALANAGIGFILSGELKTTRWSRQYALMKQTLYYLVYISTGACEFSKSDLLELLAQSREKNARLGITGMLLHKDGVFQQILEGPEEAVKSLFETIRADKRHRGVIKILDGYQDKRQFPDWSMGFCDLNSAEAAAVPGYTPFLNTPLTDQQFISKPTTALRLMLAFKKNVGT
jgi:hypothetical protein